MSHPVVLGLFDDASAAAAAARGLRGLPLPAERVSVVTRSHDEEGALARATGASPGSELEDSPTASRLGELGAHLIAAIAVVMPGIGPIVADGPLAAGFGEAAGHLAGGIAPTLERAGLTRAVAQQWEGEIRRGAFLVGGHVQPPDVERALDIVTRAGSRGAVVGTWED